MKVTAARAARGRGSPSQDPPSPPQRRGSRGTAVKDRCAICLDRCRKPSFVMPCLHFFCYACILWWANNKTQCPVCKKKMTSILHSVRADDDFEEHAIIPPMIAPVVLPASRARREPGAPDLHCPGEHQQWGTAGDVPSFVGGFELPNWMSCFSENPAILQTLHSWFCQGLEMLFATPAPRAQHTRVPEQRRRREDRHLPRRWDTRGATGQGDSSSSPTPGPARSSLDEMPCMSSRDLCWGPEQEPPEEPEWLFQSRRNFVRGRDPSPGGPQRPRKRRASSPKGSPARRRPRH